MGRWKLAHLRSQLALTYAAIALLTAGLLGGILVGLLANYYSRSEGAYLHAASEQLLREPIADETTASAEQWVLRAAVLTQSRVRLYDGDGELKADSGSPSELDPGRFTASLSGQHRRTRDGLPRPLGDGLFGGNTTSSSSGSSQSLRVDLTLGSGYFVLSEPPVSGHDVLLGIIQAWALAAALAVALAALAGYLLSSRLSKPVAQLTDASNRMAEGDLTARAEVARADEFGRLAQSFNAMAERIETTVVSLRRFVADAAHEIGTPLTALEADLELAEKAATTPDESRLVGRALGQARRLEDLTSGLLRLSRIETRDEDDCAGTVDVAAVARGAADAIASRAEAADLEFDLAVAAGPLLVHGSAAKLEVVVESLLDNAVKFTPPAGRITLSVATSAGFVLVAVTDTGMGIPAEEIDAVFERFHRARNVAAYPGSGLGLAIVQATVMRCGGDVAVESSEAGTTFEVRLPLA